MVRQYSLRLWPNGEFGVGLIRKFELPRRVKGGYPEKPSIVSWTKGEVWGWVAGMIERGYDGKWAYDLLCPEHRATAERSGALGLSSVPNSHSRRRRGEKGLSTYAKRMLRNGCYLLEREVGKTNVSMVTTTLPSCPDDVQKEISHEWPEIVRVFCQRLHRALKAVGGNTWVIGCIEIQEERMEVYGGFPLHLHVVFQAKYKKEWRITPAEIKEAWKSAVISRVPSASAYSFDAATRIELVRKSVSGYLCKYLSKGVTDNVVRKESEGFRVPTSWWIGVGNFKKRIKKSMVVDTSELASRFMYAIFHNSALLQYIGYVRIGAEGQESVVGWYGQLRDGVFGIVSRSRESAFPDPYPS